MLALGASGILLLLMALRSRAELRIEMERIAPNRFRAEDEGFAGSPVPSFASRNVGLGT